MAEWISRRFARWEGWEMKKKFKVQIISFDYGEVVKEIACFSKREAKKVDWGININLYHEHYYTRIVKEPVE
jgi:hypothetical protein